MPRHELRLLAFRAEVMAPRGYQAHPRVPVQAHQVLRAARARRETQHLDPPSVTLVRTMLPPCLTLSIRQLLHGTRSWSGAGHRVERKAAGRRSIPLQSGRRQEEGGRVAATAGPARRRHPAASTAHDIEVLEENSDTSWAIFQALQQQQERGFEKTRPIGLQDAPTAEPARELTVDDVMGEVRPQQPGLSHPQAWQRLYDFLPNKAPGLPPVPATHAPSGSSCPRCRSEPACARTSSGPPARACCARCTKPCASCPRSAGSTCRARLRPVTPATTPRAPAILLLSCRDYSDRRIPSDRLRPQLPTNWSYCRA